MKRSGGKTLFDFFAKKQNTVGASVSEKIDSAAILDDVATTRAEDFTLNPEVEVTSDCVATVNIPNQVQQRDPLRGKQAAFEFFKDGPFQPCLNNYPQTKGRRFRSTWFKEYKWLEYSIAGDKAFCFPCRLFGVTAYDMTFISNGFKNWKKAVQRFKEHESTSSHITASQRWQEGAKSKQSVLSKISSQHQEEVNRNREYLKILFQSLLFLARQGLALRGHRENESSDNRGNYVELLKLRSLDNELLKKMFLDKKKFFNYSHHDVQNEMLAIMANQTRTCILESAKNSKHLSILVDETPDVSHHEQVTLVIRYVTEELEIKECFLGFYKTDLTDGETLYKMLISTFEELGIDPRNIIAQCYDGAGNMSGCYKGVASRMKEKNPHVMYVHCYMHSLNLALVDASKNIVLVRSVFSTVQQIYCFIEASPKRHAVFATVKNSACENKNLSLKALSDTRFSSRYESLKAVQQHLIDILNTLEIIEATDPKTGGEAHSLIMCIIKFEFVFGLSVTKQVFEKTNILSKYIQNHDVSVHEVVDIANRIMQSLADFRSEQKFREFWSEALALCKTHNLEGPTIQRKRMVPQKHGGGNVHPEFKSPEEFYIRNFYYPLLDTISENIKGRFEKNHLSLLCHMETLLTASMKRSVATDLSNIKHACSAVCEAFEFESDNLLAEIDVFSRSRNEHVKIDHKLIFMLKQQFQSENIHNQNVFPNLLKLLKLYLTVPVSTASAERSFSVLKRVKTYLRNTMLQERLSHLAILAIEKMDLNLDDCVEVYAKQKQRHLTLF